jgi:hypothetical protein
MGFTLNLTPKSESYLRQQAEQQGISVEAYTSQLLTEYVSTKEKQGKLVNLLQSWLDDDVFDEQQETGDYLIQALDEDRLSDRKLFPTELQGKTW